MIPCEWGEWSLGDCSAECGTGTRTKTRVKTVDEANGGACIGEPTKTEECKDKECPGNYFSDLYHLGYVDKTLRLFNIQEILILHIICIHNAVDCEWNDWIHGTCSKSCEGGVRTNTRGVKTAESHGGNKCDGVASMVESCNPQKCPGYKNSLSESPITDILRHTYNSAWFLLPSIS